MRAKLTKEAQEVLDHFLPETEEVGEGWDYRLPETFQDSAPEFDTPQETDWNYRLPERFRY